MASYEERISIKRVIDEICEMISCEFCGRPAKGLADSDDGDNLLSCGRKDCGTNFQSGEGNPFFATRDNLLQVARRCLNAEGHLALIAPLAERCKKIKDNLDKYGYSSEYAPHTYHDACEELWQTVIDLTSQ